MTRENFLEVLYELSLEGPVKVVLDGEKKSISPR
jgi:hypothetical protein